ncbi:MAG: hypothetical protein A2Z03_00655 [Chloroflexi bacterium RBG_16_56_8]|nr:MAG: hypothetical protein A2Z03_00655 [Chloroflexi bacterium RBG_16_56_8]
MTLAELENELADPDSLRARIFGGLSHLLKARASSPAFDPYGKQRVLEFNPGVFAMMRLSEQSRAHVLCLHNITAIPQTVEIEKDETIGMGSSRLRDLLSQEEFEFGSKLTLQLSSYQSRWLV